MVSMDHCSEFFEVRASCLHRKTKQVCCRILGFRVTSEAPIHATSSGMFPARTSSLLVSKLF